MKIAYSNTKSSEWIKVFCNSIKNGKHEPIYVDTRNVKLIRNCDAVFITGYSYKGSNIRESMIIEARRYKKPVIYVDASAFDDLKDYYSITINKPKRAGIDYSSQYEIDDTRWNLIKNKVVLKDWQDTSRKKVITVLVHNLQGYKTNTTNTEDQLSNINSFLNYIKKINKSKDIEVWESWHPKYVSNKKPKSIPLQKIWTNSIYCVGWHTNTMCQSVLNGIPIVCFDEECFAYDMASKKLDEIVKPDRTKWLNRLSYINWSKQEIEEGKQWHILNQPLYQLSRHPLSQRSS